MKSADRARARTVDMTPAVRSRKIGAAVALLVMAVAAAYANGPHHPFIFEDGPSIVEDQSIRNLASLHVLAVPQDVATASSYSDRPDRFVSSSTKLGLGLPPSCRIIVTSVQALS